MPYLTKEEYESFNLSKIESQIEFDNLLAKASIVLDAATHSFYQFFELSKDPWELRKSLFKKAIAIQIDHSVITKVSSSADIKNKPTSISQSIGSSSATQSFQNSLSNSSDYLSSVLANEIISILAPTGLLYSGVEYV